MIRAPDPHHMKQRLPTLLFLPVETVTSLRLVDDVETVLNQVQDAYDGWGNLIEEWQAHDGAVDTQTTPGVQYVYDDGATDGVAKYLRLTDVIYPNGQDVQYHYGDPETDATDYVMSRLSSISDSESSATDAAYTYLGLSTIVVEDYVQSQTKLTYLDSSDNVTGLDRFGRVVDQVWEQYYLDNGNEVVVDGPPTDEYTYQYDRAGNVTDRINALDSALNDHDIYDGLNRLIEWDEGSPLTPKETWSLDSLGNNLRPARTTRPTNRRRSSVAA